MSAEETVFCIPGLRLLILSYYLENKKKERISCKNYIKHKIEDKIDTIIYYCIQKLYDYRISTIR
jgi:hypothetical protein